jgi:mannan endo-1,6-alpha-mannosidase
VYLTGLDKKPAEDPAPSSASTATVTATPSTSISTVLATSTGSSSLDTTDLGSIKAAASTIAKDLVSLYKINNTVPGILPSFETGEEYYWWEGGAMMNALVDYWKLTGDEFSVDTVKEA